MRSSTIAAPFAAAAPAWSVAFASPPALAGGSPVVAAPSPLDRSPPRVCTSASTMAPDTSATVSTPPTQRSAARDRGWLRPGGGIDPCGDDPIIGRDGDEPSSATCGVDPPCAICCDDPPWPSRGDDPGCPICGDDPPCGPRDM